MAWTPYVGDPSEQVGEYAAPHVGPQGLAAGLRRSLRPSWSRRAGMNTGARLQTAMAPAVGVERFTPDQVFFRDSIADGHNGGRYVCEPGQVADRNLNLIKRHADGTCDMIGLEADGQFYLDLGGQGGRDTRAGRP